MAIERIEDDVFRPGQAWSYKTRPHEPESRVLIGCVERTDRGAVVVHIQLVRVAIRSPHIRSGSGIQTELGHVPITKEALLASVVGRAEGNELDEASFSGGYALWREAFDARGAGWFTLSVAEILQYMEIALASARS